MYWMISIVRVFFIQNNRPVTESQQHLYLIMGKSKDRRKEQHKEKKKKKSKQKKYSRSRSRSRSYHSSSDKSSPSSRRKSAQKYTNKKQLEETFQVKNPKESFGPRKNKINTNVLTNIIFDQKKTNRKLDEEEISRAARNFKQTFTQQIIPVTMSSFLSNEDLIKRVQAKQIKGSLHCELCKEHFQTNEQLLQHLQQHSHNRT